MLPRNPEKEDYYSAQRTLHSRVIDRYQDFFGERIIGFYQDRSTEEFFADLGRRVALRQPLLRMPVHAGSDDMTERLGALAEIKAVLPENNIEAAKDTHNRTLENLMKLALLAGRDIDTLSLHFALLSSMLDDDDVFVASQVLLIWGPLAGVLGMFDVKSKLEDRAFQITNPDEYAEIIEAIKGKGDEANELKEEAEWLRARIAHNLGPDYRVSAEHRVKSIYSIWQKHMSGKLVLSDYLGTRLIIGVISEDEGLEVEACYTTRDTVTTLYPEPVGGYRHKDYIANPKPNGYQSLHVTLSMLIGDIYEDVEVQIRTEAMNDRSETDVFLHQQYVGRRHAIGRRDTGHVKRKNHSILAWRSDVANALRHKGYYERSDLMADRIVFFNADGNVFLADVGDTLLDGAFRIHSDYAGSVTEIRLVVNGEPTLAAYERELVEGDCIVFSYNDEPTWSSDWKFKVRSEVAKKWLERADLKRHKHQYALKGRQLVAEEMARQRLAHKPLEALSTDQIKEALRRTGYVDLETMLACIGKGRKGKGTLVRLLAETPYRQREEAPGRVSVVVPGMEGCNIPVVYAGCCDGMHAEHLVARYSARLGALNVHDAACAGVVNSNQNLLLIAERK